MQSAPIDLSQVRRLFARPNKVAGSDFLRREIAGRMMEKLALVKITPSHLLDAGCGDGADVMKLRNKFPQSHALGIDASESLLALALDHQQGARNALCRLLSKWVPISGFAHTNSAWMMGDFARLPLASQSVDLIWSNLALHWHPQPDVVFTEWRRVLRAEGLLMFSCFGPDTLIELRRAFAGIGESPRTLPFVDMHDLGDMLVNAGFSTPVMDMEKITLTYQHVSGLLADVRALGGNPLLTRARGLLGRHAYKKMIESLERLRNAEGRIPLTFEIIYGHAFKPVPKTTKPGESIIRLDFPKKKI